MYKINQFHQTEPCFELYSNLMLHIHQNEKFLAVRNIMFEKHLRLNNSFRILNTNNNFDIINELNHEQ